MKTKASKYLSILMAVLLLASMFAVGCGEKNEGKDSDSGKTTTEASKKEESSGTIKLGLLEDMSGDFAYQGVYKTHAVELAVKEINEAGGLLGRQVEIVAPDAQSDTQKIQELARKLILEDKVDVIMGGTASAGREAIRPLMEEHNMVYFYNNQYEGGVASHNTFCTGVIPDHQILSLIEMMVEEYGPKCYIISADYNFGQISAEWVQKALDMYGGELVGKEFLPLSESQFSSSIDKIQNAKADFLFVLLTGSTQSSFYGQWATAGLDIPMASTVNIAQGYEHLRFDPPALANMYIAAPFIEELDTPEAKEFKEKYRALYPDDPYMGMETENCYVGVKLWAKAVEKAGTTDSEEVIKALESGITVDGPGGPVTLDPKTHHTVRNVYIFKCDENHELHLIKTFDQMEPNWLSDEKGIDLTKDAPNEQYTPLD